MANVAPKSIAHVRGMDCVHLEAMQRETLAIYSYMDAYVAAITADIIKDSDASPYILRTLSVFANSISEIARSSIASLHQLVLYRRDMN